MKETQLVVRNAFREKKKSSIKTKSKAVEFCDCRTGFEVHLNMAYKLLMKLKLARLRMYIKSLHSSLLCATLSTSMSLTAVMVLSK